MNELHQVQIAFLLLLAFIVGFGTLARLLKIAYPILLVIGGLCVSFIPGLPAISLQPDLVFAVMLPPLLFSAAFTTSWREFRANLDSIVSLAFALVALTVVGVALAAHWLLPGFDWRLGLVLGAILSPTDAIAATTIASRIGLPRRAVDVLEGESLINDGSGLLALQVSLAMVVDGVNPTPLHLLGSLFYLVLGGLAVGLLVGAMVYQFELWVDDGPVEVAASLVTPYLAYFGAEAIHSSGVLAAVACGLFLGRRSSAFFSSGVRLQTASTWSTLTFILNGIAFLLIGLQLPVILQGIQSTDRGEVLLSAGVTILVIVGLRLLWIYPSVFLARWFRRYVLGRPPLMPVPLKGMFIVGWTGMRGVVSLAAAFALPTELADGSPFPQRNIIVVITFAVIFATTVLGGFTLAPIMRVLNLSTQWTLREEEWKARRTMLDAALQHAEELRSNENDDNTDLMEDIIALYKRRLSALEKQQSEPDVNGSARLRDVTNELRSIERSAALRLRDEQKISDSTLRKLERELDLLDVRFEHEV